MDQCSVTASSPSSPQKNKNRLERCSWEDTAVKRFAVSFKNLKAVLGPHPSSLPWHLFATSPRDGEVLIKDEHHIPCAAMHGRQGGWRERIPHFLNSHCLTTNCLTAHCFTFSLPMASLHAPHCLTAYRLTAQCLKHILQNKTVRNKLPTQCWTLQ